MTLSYRPKSPILEKVNCREQKMFLTEEKIHRILLKNEAICEFVSIESPNCIWFKMQNHVSEQLRVTLDKEWEKLEQIYPKHQLKEYEYVMAPLEEGIYARARIIFLQTFDDKLYVYVHFIDEGVGAWVLSKCLAKMNSDFRSQPWQAFPISLFKLEIGKDLINDEIVTDDDDEYLVLVTKELNRIIAEFDVFKLVPVIEKFQNDYCQYIKAEIYGLKIDEVDKLLKKGVGESIAHRLAIESDYIEIVNRKIYSGNHQPLKMPNKFKKLSREEADKLFEKLPNWHRDFPIKLNQKINNHLPNGTINLDWSEEIKPPQIEPISLGWLQAHCADESNGNGNQLMLCLDWHSLKSPFEFYGYPLRHPTNGSSELNPIRHFYNLHSKLTAKLDQFYGNSINRKPVELQIIVMELSNGKQPFAVYEKNDEAYGNSFRRVQVIAIRNLNHTHDYATEFVRIRYLDIGGNEVVPIAGLLKIHSSHCVEPPMCIQLSLNNIKPPNQGSSWTQEECLFFKSLIRVDIPAKSILNLMELRNAIPSYYSSANAWPGVFDASYLKIGQDNRCLEDKMVLAEKASWS